MCIPCEGLCAEVRLRSLLGSGAPVVGLRGALRLAGLSCGLRCHSLPVLLGVLLYPTYPWGIMVLLHSIRELTVKLQILTYPFCPSTRLPEGAMTRSHTLGGGIGYLQLHCWYLLF